jgi:hypothetical protein
MVDGLLREQTRQYACQVVAIIRYVYAGARRLVHKHVRALFDVFDLDFDRQPKRDQLGFCLTLGLLKRVEEIV